MSTRRNFMGQVLGGAGTLAAYSLFPAARVLGANDRVRFALIGAGGRGQEIFRAAVGCKNVEAVAIADLYTRRLDEAKRIAPAAQTYSDPRRVYDDKGIDAVLIATPQHQHALNFVPAIQAGKDVYQEKTMAFDPDHARRMKAAFQGSGRVVQVGIQSTSGPGVARVKELSTPDRMGTITALHTHHFRNHTYGGWMRKTPPDCDLQHVDWKTFQGEAARHEFTPTRFYNWRFFWDYSGGNVYENMVHQVGFWYKTLNLSLPTRVTMTGNNYLSPDMEPPDTMDVSIDTPEKILFTWNSMFGNNYYGEGDDLLLGNKGTIHRTDSEEVTYLPQGRHAKDAAKEMKTPNSQPDIIGESDATGDHMANFFDCVRTRKEPNCPFEIGYRSSIVCQMANRSYREGRTVRWDPEKEDIV
jgi:predicted dehydrogenase